MHSFYFANYVQLSADKDRNTGSFAFCSMIRRTRAGAGKTSVGDAQTDKLRVTPNTFHYAIRRDNNTSKQNLLQDLDEP